MIVKNISAGETFDIRIKVLRENIPLPYEFEGDYDPETIHLGAFDQGMKLGVASFMKVDLQGFEGRHYQLRGMAILPEFQGRGIGRLLLEHGEKMIIELNCNMIWCNARIVAVKFYEKLGYQIIGDEFEIKHVGAHYKMIKKI